MRIFIASAGLLLAWAAQAAMLHATIQDQKGQPLPGANLSMVGSQLGAASGLDGKAYLHHVPPGAHRFRVSCVGYGPVEVEFEFEPASMLEPVFTLVSQTLELQSVTVTGKAPSGLDLSGARPVDRIGAEDVPSAVGGNGALSLLSGVSGVDSKPCALCGSAGVGLQGLDPSYTEIQVDGLPVLAGLGALYGVEGVRATGLQAAELQRGASSSGQGGGAVTGTVNLISRELSGRDTLGLTLSLGDGFNHEAGIFLEHRLAGLPSRLELDLSGEPQRLDRNDDGLTDAPEQERLGGKLSQELRLDGSRWIWSLRGLREQRFAGDIDWTEADRGSATVYGRDIHIRRAEAMLNGSWQDGTGRQWTFSQAWVQHRQDSWYGVTEFDATQRRYLGRLSVDAEGWGGQNRLELGLSWDDYRDNLDLGVPTDRLDQIPHLALSHQRLLGEDWQLDAGLRVEHHREDGLVPLLRAALRWQLANEWSLHAGLGQSWRPVTIFSLDKAVHAGFDGVRLGQELKPEQGLSLQAGLSRDHLDASHRSQSSLRLFATEFRDKAILAYVAEAGVTEYANASRSFSRGASLAHSITWFSGWRVEGEASLAHVRYRKDGQWHEEHMVNRWNGSMSVARQLRQTTLSAKWQVHGPQRLPEGRSREESPVWSVLTLGLDQTLGAWKLGLYLHNALDYVQPDDPFVRTTDGELIDSAMIYGPMVGRRIRLVLSTGW